MTEQQKPTVSEMLRATGRNTANFMDQVSAHVEKLEYEIIRLTERVQELEGSSDDFKRN